VYMHASMYINTRRFVGMMGFYASVYIYSQESECVYTLIGMNVYMH